MIFYGVICIIFGSILLMQALDLIGPIYRTIDSYVGVREKSCILFAYGLLLMKQHDLQEARYIWLTCMFSLIRIIYLLSVINLKGFMHLAS